MSDLTLPRLVNLSVTREVMSLVEMVMPDNANSEPLLVKASRELLNAYLLYQVDSLNYPDEIEYTLLRIQSSIGVSKDIHKILKKTYVIQFSFPKKMKEGYFYIALDEKINEIRYAVMKGARCYQGEILDKEYEHFKQRLRKTGTLPLKEVNFLIEKVVRPRRHLKKNAEVIDPLCCRSFSHFLTFDQNTQTSAVQLLISRLQSFGNFSLYDTCWHGFNHFAPRSPNDLKDILFNYSHMKDYYQSEKLMTDEAIYWRKAEHYQTQLEMDEDENKSL